MSPAEQIDQLARCLKAGNAVAFTGAGISTESGIPDFRSPGGVWSRHKPVMFHDFLNDPTERRRYWQIRRESVPAYLAARPNAGHLALVSLEETGRLRGVITQNIDELHQRAGSRQVIEIHGTAMRVACLSCDMRWGCQAIQLRVEAGDLEPACESCGGMLKSMTISFGQAMPEEVFQTAVELAGDCDLFLAIGSSLVVQPAASLPLVAKRSGARLVIINQEPTPLDEHADLVIHAPIGKALSSAIDLLNA
jgi:NAD-dependent deacetylase